MTGARRKTVLAAGAVVTVLAAVTAGAGAAGLVPGTGPKVAAWTGISLGVVFGTAILAAMAMVLRGADLMLHADQEAKDDGR